MNEKEAPSHSEFFLPDDGAFSKMSEDELARFVERSGWHPYLQVGDASHIPYTGPLVDFFHREKSFIELLKQCSHSGQGE